MERLTELKYDITKLDSRIKNMQERIEKMAFDDKAEVGVKFLASTVSYLKELREYKQLEEQGLLLRLPCKVGCAVYCIYERYTKCSENEQEFDEYSCQGCECLECDSHKELYVQSQKAYSLDWIVSNLKRFGKTVFLTKEEAEAKLKELRCNHD